MSNFKLGMYVRCPFEFNTRFPRDYLVGQIIKIDEDIDKITVRFFAHDNLAEFCGIPDTIIYEGKQIVRCNLALHEIVKTASGKNGEIYALFAPKEKNEYVTYCLLSENKNVLIKENDIIATIDQGNFSPINQMLKYEINNPAWYKARSIVSQSMQNIVNSPFGFETLLGSRTYLFNHQVDTIITALTTQKCKYMLADEVGLGKTIEACTIIKGLLSKYSEATVLFIVPDSLIYQWQNELSSKFWIDVPIVGVNDISKSNMFLISQEYLEKYDLPFELKVIDFDILLVDETHRLLFNNTLYESILDLSRNSENVLLLSATPITKMTNEYHKLLTLLNPERYEQMSISEFDELMEKQKIIRNRVYDLMSDLPDYNKYDLFDDFKYVLNEISDMINDVKFNKIIDDIDHNSADKGYNQIKLALAYLSEFYQIDQNIIRHRRKEIQEQDIKRIGQKIDYDIQGLEMSKHDYPLYENILSYIEYLTNNNRNCVETKGLNLLCSCFSGPEAVISTVNQLIKTANSEEYSLLNSIDTLAKYCLKEINGNGLKDRENVLINYLTNNGYKKILIFTGFAETSQRLEKILNEKFGKGTAVSFNLLKSREESQESVDIFQNEELCRFIICDESGGEGRNFQIADEIIHYDLPLSTFALEQRIGRLDRIGRKSGKDVISTVIVAKNTLEEDVFKMYNEGLNIFNESMCGLEIVFQQIQEQITNAFTEDVRTGLSKIQDEIKNTISMMKEEVDKERYFDLAKQFDTNKMEIYNNLINYFSDNDGEIVIDTMISWAKMAGFLGIHVVNKYNDDLVFSIDINTRKSFNIQCAKNSFYFPPKMDDIIKRSKFKNEIYGTFSRETALKHENLTFFAPGNSMYDGIVNNAMKSYKGRCTALKNNSDVDLKAFKIVFNVRFSVKPLIDKDISVNMINYIKQYITTSQLSIYYNIDTNQIIDDYEIIEKIENAVNAKNSKHLGKRDNGAIEKFVLSHPKADWSVILQNAFSLSRDLAKEKSLLCVKIDYAINQLENKFNSIMARKIYFNEGDLYKDFNLETLEVLKTILQKPTIDMDSIAYIELVNKEEILNEQ